MNLIVPVFRSRWGFRFTPFEWGCFWGGRFSRVPGLYAIGWDVRVWWFGPFALFRDKSPGEL